MTNDQGRDREVRHRLDRNNRVPAGAERNGERAVGEGVQRRLESEQGILSVWTTGVGSGDPALDVMAASVAVFRQEDPPGWGPDRVCPETCG